MQKKFTVFLLSMTAFLSAFIGYTDLFEKNEVICATSACAQVHDSSFSTLFGVPVGFYAAGFLILALWLYLKKKNVLFALLMWVIMGAEAYFTFLQIVFIRAFCISCFIFFGFLIACVIVSGAFRLKTVLIGGLVSFLGAHFVFFFPLVQLKSTLMGNPAAPETTIEIFASPSCLHCEEAISKLSGICKRAGAGLRIKPVCISRTDKQKNVEWISGSLFQCGSSTSNRLAEKIVWDNEAEARRLNSGTLQVPLILMKSTSGFQEIFQGWDTEIQDRLLKALATIADRSARNATAGELTRFNRLQNHTANFKKIGAICSKTSGCHEKN